MGTYSELQTLVNRRVIDLSSSVQAEVPTLIKDALRTLQTEHNFRIMEALISAQQTTEDTRTLVATPDNFKEFRDQEEAPPYRLSNLGDATFLQVLASRDNALREYGDQDTGPPMFILRSEPTTEAGASNLEVWPLPDANSDFANGNYRVYVPYYKFLSELSGNDDTNWFTVNAEKYIVDKATAEAFALDWDYEATALWLQKADAWKKEIVKRDKMTKLSGITTLIPNYRGTRFPRTR